MFISFEGIDGSGKSTQARMLYEYMHKKSMEVVLTAEPTDGKIGDLMKSLIQGRDVSVDPTTLQLLFIADRSDHVDKFINPNLVSQKNVITDRYLISTIAYGISFDINEQWLKNANNIFPYPDYNFIIDVDPSIALGRIGKRNNGNTYFERKDFLDKIRNNYIKLGEEYKNYYILDGNKPEEEVSSMVHSILKI